MNFLKRNIFPILIGTTTGIIISIIFYPCPKTEEIEVIKEMPVYVETEVIKEVPVYVEILPEIEYEYLGKFTLTAYCSCAKCCGKSNGITATGVKATPKHTVAVDPSKIPYGSKLLIMGNVYIAEDCGGAVKGNVIDIYFDTHEEAVKFGKQSADVHLIEEGGAE